MCAKKKHADLLRGQMGLIWLIFLYSLLLKPLSGEDSQGKINQSILTLWVTQVSVGIQSITLDLLCNYALLNVIIDHWTKSFGFCMDFMVAQKDMIILERSCIKSMLIDGGHNQNTISFLLAHLI
ncbi:uncharacterized protein LOC144619022 isoform X1 [Crassostrea virginica]